MFYKKIIKIKIINVFSRGGAKSYFSTVLAVGLAFFLIDDQAENDFITE